MKIVRGAPLVDVAATGYAVYDDVHNHNWSLGHTVAADGAATLAGVAAGTAVAVIDAPAVAVAGLGFAAGYEATEAVKALTHDAHWGANIDKYGVIGGIGHSFEDAGSALAESNVDMAKNIGHAATDAAQGLWHGVFG